MRSSIIAKIKAGIKKEEMRETELSMLVAAKFQQILSTRKYKQKDLAELLGKQESEISKLLSGKHNFTISTIASIETVLEQNIISIDLFETEDTTKMNYQAVAVGTDVQYPTKWEQESNIFREIKDENN